MSFNCVRLRRCVHCSRLISFGPLLPILGKPSPIFGRRPFARIRRKGSVRHLTMGWMPHCTLYNRRRQHCLFTNWEAVVPSKKTKWLAFSASHIWIQTCTLLPNVYISPPFDHTLICSDRARAIHPHLWRQICHFGQIFEFRNICQGKSSLKRHTRHLLLHNRLAENFIWASKDKNVIVSKVNGSIYPIGISRQLNVR